MKKGTIVAIVLAIVLIIIGSILLAIGLSFAGSDTRESMLITREVDITGYFDSIQIKTSISNVKFVPYNGTADPRVILSESESYSHTVVVEEGTLKIEVTDNRDWTDYIGVFGINGENPEITLYLPLEQYKSILITTDTGDMLLPQLMSGKETVLRSNTGDIRCENASCETMDCMTDTGDILMNGIEALEIRLTATTGDITLTNGEAEDIHLKNTTGEKELENVVCERLTCESKTGDVELEWVNAKKYLQIFTTTGSVGMESCQAGQVNIETDTGDVEGSLLTPMRFQASSDTGDIRVPQGLAGGECRIQTDTGDIHFR